MLSALQEEQGSFLSNLILTCAHYVIPKANDELIVELALTAEKIKFGPNLVIANIIYNSYGPYEATKYAIALIKGDAT